MTDAITTPTGRVLLVGGGPGDPGLLTVAGRDALIAADVVITDRLAPIAAIAEHAPQAEVIHVGKIPRGEFTPQERINELLVEHARAGKVVVRLKGGDGYLFGRGGEEWQHCTAAGIPVEIVPGVSSAFSVPALAGIPVTHRGLSQGVAVVSGHVAPEDPRSEVDWAALATSRLTIVILMGVATLGSIAEALIAAGLPADTPAACIADGAGPQQRTMRAALSEIASAADEGGFAPPAITVVGEVVDALGGAPG